ncbi:MAG: hypothetical protein HQ578_04705, partial [Chloroflexi bacterium]|nr:hypothetical protein [Chloroflexota bacterium]
MITVEQILASRKAKRSKPDKEDFRRLPFRKAFIYGRVSSPGQVRDSHESIREIASLVILAKEDGYKTGLHPEQVEEWLLSIQKGTAAKGVMEDGEVLVNVQDLGLSGQLSSDRREGLTKLQRSIEAGQTGAVYVTEGVGRLSRDQDRILPFQLLKMLKEHQCRLRTPEGIWNPAIDSDWEVLAEEFEDAIGELKVWRKRLFRRKAQKATRGEFVGEPIPAGYILSIVGQKPNGKYVFGKMQPYPPHAEVVRRILEEYVNQQGSGHKTVRALGGLTFPFFPPELAYMERLSVLRACPKTPGGYEISPVVIKGLATNPKLIGISVWGDGEPVPNNHEPAVPLEVFLSAYELAVRPGKPKGRAVKHEPLEWARLLWCCNHPEPVPMYSGGSQRKYFCEHDFVAGRGPVCLVINHRFIDEPLTSEVLRQLDFTPYAEEVLAKLEDEASQGRVGVEHREREITAMERKLENLSSYLGCGDPDREEIYWEQFRATKELLERLRASPMPEVTTAPADIAKVKGFLSGLASKWPGYSPGLRNRLLKLLIERVELRHEGRRIEATILWKAGFEQRVVIQRPKARSSRDNRWTDEENRLLTTLWPSATKEALQAALLGRSWQAINCHATHLKLRRERHCAPGAFQPRWTPAEESRARSRYEAGIPMPEMVEELGRGRSAILNKAAG